MSENRAQWTSNFGFLMSTAGAAIGLGNIWRFPYITGKYGGSAFVIVFLINIVIIAIPLLIAEIALGRCAQSDAVGTFEELGGKRWRYVGVLAIISSFLILSYYTVITGWTLMYMFNSLTGLADAAAAGKTVEFFNVFASDPYRVVFYQAVVIFICILVLYRGIASGIEKMCKFMIPLLFVILIMLVIRSLMLPGAVKGLNFLLKPDFSKLSYDCVLEAVGQAFYSSSLACGGMITYGSYLGKDENIPTMSCFILFLNTLVAIFSGFIIFSAVFSFGGNVDAGPSLIFVTLPDVFARMAFGKVFSFTFFALLFLAAITSAFSLLEVLVSFGIDHLKWTRQKSVIIMGGAIALFGLPSALSVGGHFPQIYGKDFLDAVDFIINNVALPIGGIFTAIFVGWFWKKSKNEVTNHGKLRFRFYKAWLWMCRVIAPLFIAFMFIKGLKW